MLHLTKLAARLVCLGLVPLLTSASSGQTPIANPPTQASSQNPGAPAAPLAATQGAHLVAELAILAPQNPDWGDDFGSSIAISGDTAVLGAWGENSAAIGVNGDQADNSAPDSGAAYVFVRSGGMWTFQAYLKASNTEAGDEFGGHGMSVAISGDTIAVGAWKEDSAAVGIGGDQSSNAAMGSGAVYVFVRNGTNWTQEAFLKASNTGAGDNFGYSVALQDDRLVVGAPGEDSSAAGIGGNQLSDGSLNSGAVYGFTRSGSTWAQSTYIKASNSGTQDRFGASIALDGDTLIVGADSESSGIPGDPSNNGSFDAGAAYAFVDTGGVWSEQAYLKASNPDSQDKFGTAVALSGDTVVIGAPSERSTANGVNGDQADNSESDVGAAYVLVRNGTTWTQEAYLKASNSDGANSYFAIWGDFFGWSVAVAGDAIAIGAHGEASCDFGLNGKQYYNSCNDAGAVYHFTRAGGTWSQKTYIKASIGGLNAQYFGGTVALSGTTLMVSGSGFGTGCCNDEGRTFVFDTDSPGGALRYGALELSNWPDLYSTDAPHPGSTMTLTAYPLNDGGSPAGTAFLVISAAPAALPLTTGWLYVDLSLSLFGAGMVVPVPLTNSAVAVALTIPPGLAGTTVYAQVASFAASGLLFTNGLEIAVYP